MSRKKKRDGAGKDIPDNLRLNPQQRLCAKFDQKSLADFPIAPPGKMGFRVEDNCAEEHTM